MSDELHGIVRATISKHLADAILAVERLESTARTIPATSRGSEYMLRLMKRTTEAKAIAEGWSEVMRALDGVRCDYDCDRCNTDQDDDQ